MKRKEILLTVVIEISMLLGVFLAMFLVPPHTPLKSFLIIAACFFVLGNVLLFRLLQKRKQTKPASSEKFDAAYRRAMMPIGIALGLAILWKLFGS